MNPSEQKHSDEIKSMCIKFNNLYCNPPLDSKEFEKMWDDALAHVTKQEMEKDAMASNGIRTELITVAEAIRRSSGKVAVNGLIVGISSVIQVIKETQFECSAICRQNLIPNSTIHHYSLYQIYYPYDDNKRKCISCNSTCYGPKRNTEISAMIIQLQD